MKYQIKSRFQRISPRKLRGLTHLIKGIKTQELEQILAVRIEKGSRLILKMLKSALNSAESKDADMESLKVQNIMIDQGPKLKRRKIRARGRADVIQKRYSHITMILEDKKSRRSRKRRDVEDSDQRVGKKTNKVNKKKINVDKENKPSKVSKSKTKI